MAVATLLESLCETKLHPSAVPNRLKQSKTDWQILNDLGLLSTGSNQTGLQTGPDRSKLDKTGLAKDGTCFIQCSEVDDN